MKKIGITGSGGFLGWHLRAYLFPFSKEIQVIECSQECFNSEAKLKKFVSECDVIVHLASLIRGEDDEVYKKNVALAETLVQACEDTKSTPHIIFSSSTHIDRDTAYGKAKRDSGRMLLDWGKKVGSKVSNVIFPNIFGEYAKPNYNSAVATFCYELANNKKSEVSGDGKVSLIHAQKVSGTIYELIKKPKVGDIRVEGKDIGIRELYQTLLDFKTSYFNDIVPVIHNEFHVELFNTFRSYLIDTSFYPRKLTLHSDERGSLFEMIKEQTGGQTFLSSTKPGKTRGNHYHTRKLERFCVVKGKADISLRKLLTDEVKTFTVSGDTPAYIDMPTFYTHNITNTGDGDLITAFWANEIYNKEDPDTYFTEV